jgi:metal transporter CNNM
MRQNIFVYVVLLTFFVQNIFCQSTIELFDIIIPSTNLTNGTLECINQCQIPAATFTFGLEQAIKLVAAGLCVLLSAMFSGLTLGLLGLDRMSLKIIAESGEEDERVYARRILPIREKGNYVLCTLLLGNVAVNAASAIFMSDLTSGILGLVISTGLLVVFGEIIPQAVFSRYALWLGAHTTWLVYVFMIFMFPIAYPFSIVLDWMLGEDFGTLFTNEQLKKLFEITAKHKQGELEDIEAKILGGALEFGRKTVIKAMTPIEKAYMLDAKLKLDANAMTEIWQSGRSRIPVFMEDENNVVGILLTKDLILVNAEENLPLSTVVSLYGRAVLKVPSTTVLSDMLKTFKSGRGHLAMVFDEKSLVTIGLITLEDVIEEIIHDEIVDEQEHVEPKNKNKRREGINLFNISTSNEITEGQIQAISGYLQKSYECFEIIPMELLSDLIEKAEYKYLEIGEVLYQRGQTYEFFTLVLRGKLEIKSGIDNFVINKGPWSTLALKSITEPKFRSDFEAVAVKESRIVKISKYEFTEMIKTIHGIEKCYIPEDLKWIVK